MCKLLYEANRALRYTLKVALEISLSALDKQQEMAHSRVGLDSVEMTRRLWLICHRPSYILYE